MYFCFKKSQSVWCHWVVLGNGDCQLDDSYCGPANLFSSFVMDYDRIPSTTPGAEPPRDARDSGSTRSHSMHLETSSSNRP